MADPEEIFKGLGIIIIGIGYLSAYLLALALFICLGFFYGAGVSVKNYCNAFANNVAPERPQP
jgi:hypothetical protein